MRIGQLTYSYLPVVGGGDVYVDMLLDLLSRRGDDLRVYQRRTDAASPLVRFVPNPLAHLGKGEFWTQTAFVPLLCRELRQQDVLIAHYPNYLLGAFCARRRGLPRVIGLSHGVFWDDRPRAVRSRLKRAIARAAFRRADAYVANDTFFLREMGIDAPPRQGLFSEIVPGRWCIPNCVPLPTPSQQARDAGGAAETVIVPRNLYRNRGVHLAIEAFALFCPHFPETRLLVIGKDGQPGYAEHVRRRAHTLGLGNRVAFAGHVPHERMTEQYGAAAICLIPSLCGEGTSLAALEAMACGVATISTNVAGLQDLPTVQCAPDASALADTMAEVYPVRRTTGADQRAVVEAEYSHERWSRTWLQVIDSVVANART